MKKPKYPRAQYCKDIPKCIDCGKTSTVVLHDYTNRIIGHFCKRHGEMHVKDSHQKYNNFNPDTVKDNGWQG